MSETWNSSAYADHYNTVYEFASTDGEAFLRPLELNHSDTYIDFGCGQGVALAVATRTVTLAVGVDQSEHQIELANTSLQNVNNVQLINNTMLDCNLSGIQFTKASARKSLHHLTDREKSQFFRKIGPRFPPGALFLIEDGIFQFERADLPRHLPAILEEAATYYGEKWPQIKRDFIHTLEHEFPTSLKAWTKALEDGGFEVVKHWSRSSFYGAILAQKRNLS
jgi:SAM-dependent methyltransferase